MDIGSAVGRAHGIAAEQIANLNNYRSDFNFSDLERLVLEYADGMTRTPVDVSDARFTRLRERFTEAELVELSSAIISLPSLASMLGCAQQVAPAFVTLADNLVAARTLRLVGGNRALLRGGRSAWGCALGPRHDGQEQDQNEHFVFPDSSLLKLLELAPRAHARSESRQTPPRRSWLLVVGIRPLAPARSAAKNCA